jgi:hypothetical protein
MRVRTALGLGWSLVVGLVGGWLVLSPWSLAEQGDGGWTTVTRSEVGAGLGLVLLALVGLGLVLADVLGWLREAGVLRPRARRARAAATTSPELERALLELAQTLARDMAHQRGGRPGEEPADAPDFARWREQQ